MNAPVDAMYVGIGHRLNLARKSAGLSLAAAAAEAVYRTGDPWSASRLGSYERANRRIGVDDLYQLAQVYEVPVATLLPPDPMAVVGEPMVPASIVDRAVQRAVEVMRGTLSTLVPEHRAAQHDAEQAAHDLENAATDAGTPPTIDLLAALQASVDRARADRGGVDL